MVGKHHSANANSGIVILHGTDTLLCHRRPFGEGDTVLLNLTCPYRSNATIWMKRSDAFQNLTDAIFVAQSLEAGIYCVAHEQALSFPGLTKDPKRKAFVKETTDDAGRQ
jgi:L-asparaginase/Glu-tRNA(Gln) amidotransferase subunit D